MGAGHSHAPASSRHRGRLALSLAIIGGFFLVELIGGILSGSLALLTDAAHMGADVITLATALTASVLASRAAPGGTRTFGLYRAEVLAAGLAALIMLGMAAFVLTQAIGRIGQPVEIETGIMMVVGVLGLGANIAALALLRGGSGESINVKGAYLEVLADTIGSVGVLVAGVLIIATGNPLWDTVAALAIGAFIVVRAVVLGREVLSVLFQHSPRGIDPEQVMTSLTGLPGVEDAHDLHIWTLTSGMPVATVHLVAHGGSHDVLDAASDLLHREYGISHSTIQVEPSSHDACEPDHGW
jgi:cobalt-zinc-cadmium efflux system protein